MKNIVPAVAIAAAMMALSVHTATAAEVALDQGDQTERNHSFYVGFSYGPTTVSPGSGKRSVEGIDFSLEADANDLGGSFYAGYWIGKHVALELGGRDYGTVDVPFTFSDPHDNTTGKGESEVSVGGFTASLLLGTDLAPNLQVFARAGMLSWKEELKSRFDIPGEPAIRRESEMSGTGLIYGAGLNWRFESTWALSLQYEATSLDNDDFSMVSLGLSYDFLGWVNP